MPAPTIIWPRADKPAPITKSGVLIAAGRVDHSIVHVHGECKLDSRPQAQLPTPQAPLPTPQAPLPTPGVVSIIYLGKDKWKTTPHYNWYMVLTNLQLSHTYLLTISYKPRKGTPKAKTNPPPTPQTLRFSTRAPSFGITLAWPSDDPDDPDDITDYKDDFYAYGDLDTYPLSEATMMTDPNDPNTTIRPFNQNSDMSNMIWSAQFPSLQSGSYTIYAVDTNNSSQQHAGLTVD